MLARQGAATMAEHDLEHYDRILTEYEAAKLARFSTRTLQSWRQRNFGPPFLKVGRAIRYSQIDLISWIKAQERRST